MRKKLHIYLIAISIIASITMATAQIKITEAMSNSGTGGTNDWIELTNYGSTAVDITGWKMDDSSYAFANAVGLVGVTSIPAGKSVIFLETDAPDTDIPAFKTFWGSSLDNVSVGSYPSSGKSVGLSSGGDGVIIFDALGVEINRVAVPSATSSLGKSFYWSCKADGSVVDVAVISSVGTITGTISNQITVTSANVVLGNIGSPGTAIVLPLSANVNNPDFKPWRLVGRTLKFDLLPANEVEVFSLIGSKIATYPSAREIKLGLSQGVYILRIDNKATKITIH